MIELYILTAMATIHHSLPRLHLSGCPALMLLYACGYSCAELEVGDM
ncbi:MAG: hypothetical protein MIO93_14430 [ANME-2 cluster archaeon]|nr:hypothetical protein [ANME-2 cluster archaeon]